MNLQISLRGYEKSKRICQWSESIPMRPGTYHLTLGDGLCAVRVELYQDGNALSGEAAYCFLKPTAVASSVAIEINAENWTKENYVFVPGAVYNGNRFCCQKLPYAPYAKVPKEEALTHPPVITDIPRLSDEATQSKIEFRSGDMTTPAMGYYSSRENRGFLMLTSHIANDEYTGLAIYEDLEAATAQFALSAPAVREETKYFFGERADGTGFYPHCDAASDDTGRWFEEGEVVALPFAIHTFDAEGLQDYFAYFHQVRDAIEEGEPAASVPYGIAYETIKDKFIRENFIQEEEGGYYAVGTRQDVPQQHWQAGWVGGGLNGYTFLQEDAGIAREQALATFRFVFDKLQNEGGWICGMYAKGIYYGDTFELDKPGTALLIRKDADLLYFLLKQFTLCKEKLAPYGEKLMAFADAFVRLFRKYGQIGQFVDIATEEILIGNSACGGIAPAALALAYEVFGNHEYLETAEALGQLYSREYLAQGIANGGPGEICQAPDSESAFGLLEAFVQLYETTGKDCWLKDAKAAADLAMTWVMNYDFYFPQESTAAKRGIHTVGTVFANAQNKHSAPGICTLSGNSLLKLYRFTGEEKYLFWLRNITRGLMQCVSLKERPVFCLEKKYLPAGWTNERCQTSDWEGKETIGGFLYGSNWPETSATLTYGEVPGIYVNMAEHKAYALDAMDCTLEGDTLWVENPTAYETTVTVLLDDPDDRRGLTYNYFGKMQKVKLAPGQRQSIAL